MKTIYMVNEKYIDEDGTMSNRLYHIAFSTREIAAEFMNKRADEIARVNTEYFSYRMEPKCYKVRSASLFEAYISTIPESIERIVLSTVPIEVKDES